MDMSGFIFGIFLITGTYVGSAVFAIMLFRVFFPLKVKARTAERNNLHYSAGERENSSIKNTSPILSVDGRRDWVKVNS
jgi:hypothetical protein